MEWILLLLIISHIIKVRSALPIPWLSQTSFPGPQSTLGAPSYLVLGRQLWKPRGVCWRGLPGQECCAIASSWWWGGHWRSSGIHEMWLKRFVLHVPWYIDYFVICSWDFIHSHRPGKGCSHRRASMLAMRSDVLLVLQHESWRNHKFAVGHRTGLIGPCPWLLPASCQVIYSSSG